MGRQFTAEENQLQRDFQSAYQQAGFEQQNTLAQQEAQTEKNDQIIQLALSGNLKGEDVNKTLSDLFGDGIVFTPEDELSLQRVAAATGLSVDEYTKVRQALGTSQAQLMLSKPEDFIQDPEKARQFQLNLAKEANSTQVAVAKEQNKGKVICTVLYKNGELDPSVYLADTIYAQYMDDNVVDGYTWWGRWVASKMTQHTLTRLIAGGFASHWANHMAFTVGTSTKRDRIGEWIERIGLPICYGIGLLRRMAR